ncbi:MAG: PadR family transcriptional regulator [Solirubrobacterales bacterium]
MLSNTAYIILGCIEKGCSTGYEIKATVDLSTRFFFPSSYGQIYPELKRLAAEGYIKGEAKTQGKRGRTEYKLTAAGRKELGRWRKSPGTSSELRDEGLLKLFFADPADHETLLALIRSMRDEAKSKIAELERVGAITHGHLDHVKQSVLESGFDYYEQTVEWCDRAERRLLDHGSMSDPSTPVTEKAEPEQFNPPLSQA